MSYLSSKVRSKKLDNKRCSSAGRLSSSPAGAVTSLIFALKIRKKGIVFSLILMPILFLFLTPSLLIVMFFSNGSVYADYSISMSYTGVKSIDVMPSSNSGSSNLSTGTTISEDNITITTTCKSGYNLSLGTSVNDSNLYLNGDSSNNASGTYFTPSDGTTALNNAPNTWGYYYNSSAPTTSPTKTDVFSAIPALGSTPAIIKTALSTPSSADITDNFSIYYGVAVGANLTPGAYKMIEDTAANNGTGGSNGSLVYYVTMAEPCLPYTVIFNPTSTAGGTTITGTGTMSDQIIPANVPTVLNSNTFTAPTGYEFDGWNTKQDGTGTSYTDGQSVTDLTTGNSTITLYAQWKASGLTINYNANGGYYGSSSVTNNTVVYNAGCSTTQQTITPGTKYSHTSNINDAGVQSGDYSNNASTNEVITLPGASKLYISLTYQTESTNYDWVSFWAGNYPGYTAYDNYSSGVQWSGTGSTGGKYGGTTKTTLTGTISGNTVTFGFRSDGSVTNYGYYAVITGQNANGQSSWTENITTCTKTPISGSYATPIKPGTTFLGWSESSSATTATYTNESEVASNLIASNGETKTLYAVWEALSMQSLTKSICMSQGAGTAVDTRSGISYQYKYFANLGQCWVVENMGKDVKYTRSASSSVCSGMNWNLPEKSDYDTLKATYKTGQALYAAGWSTTVYGASQITYLTNTGYIPSSGGGGTYRYTFGVTSTSTTTDTYLYDNGTNAAYVRCIRKT